MALQHSARLILPLKTSTLSRLAGATCPHGMLPKADPPGPRHNAVGPDPPGPRGITKVAREIREINEKKHKKTSGAEFSGQVNF